MIVSTWQIGYKLIRKNNNINSKDNNINMNLITQIFWAGNIQLNSTSQSWYRIWKTRHSNIMLKLDQAKYDRYAPDVLFVVNLILVWARSLQNNPPIQRNFCCKRLLICIFSTKYIFFLHENFEGNIFSRSGIRYH